MSGIDNQFQGKNQQKSFMVQYESYGVAPLDHPYILRKKLVDAKIKCTPDGRLVFPLLNQIGEYTGLQFIDANGEKRYSKGTVKKGSFYVFNGDTDTTYLCEGIGDGSTISQAKRKMVYVSFDAGNLMAVAALVKKKYPTSKIVIACDNDLGTPINVGVKYGTAAAEAIDAEISIPVHPDGLKCDFNDIHIKYGLAEVKRQLSITTTVSGNNRKFHLKHISTLQLKPVDWQVRWLLERNCLAVVFGAPGSMKSFFGISLCCHISSGIPFGGRAVKQGPCVYICGEGQSGIARRFHAWCIRNDVDIEDLPIVVSTVPAFLCEQEQVEIVLSEIKKAADYYGNPELVVIDTLSRNFGGDENQTADMVHFVGACDQIRAEYQCTVLVVHHSGLSDKNRSRGSMALKASLDTEFKIEMSDQKILTLEAMKMKDAVKPEPISFRPAVVELGVYDEDGDPVTSLVLDEVDYHPPTPEEAKRGQGKWQLLAMDAFAELVAEHEQRIADAGLSSTPRIKVDDWRDRCRNKGLSKRQDWDRVWKSLSSQGKIEISNGYVRMVG